MEAIKENKKYITEMMEKWGKVLDEGGSQFSSEKVKRSTAIMLENEYKYLKESTSWNGGNLDPNSAGYSGDGEFHKIAIPMVRRTFPELVAHDIVGVQPMTTPVGLAFALRFKADQSYSGATGTEVGYNTIDQRYSGSSVTSGGMITSAGEELGSKAGAGVGNDIGLGVGAGTHIKELSMTVEKAQVEAKTRKLRSRWSLEVAQDLKAMHGLDLEEEMMDVLAYEITAEIDRELMAKIRAVADTNASSETYDYRNFDGRWEAEKYRNMYNFLVRKANQIAIDTRRGSGNFVVAAPSVCSAFEASSSFTIMPVANDVNTAVTGVSKLGTLDGRITVYRDTFAATDDFVVGYKGPSEYDTGIIYLPYIQLLMSKATFEDSFNPAIGLMSRYAIHDQIFGSQNYYIRVRFTHLFEKSA